MVGALYSIVVPVYRNAEFVPLLVEAFTELARTIEREFAMEIEVVFVVDASPDDSYERLAAALPGAAFRSQLLLHARNFGSFAAIRTGLAAGRGRYFGVIAADLQEPPELLVSFLRHMFADEADVVVGIRESREDPGLSRFASNLFWAAYRRAVIREMPKGGVDVFGCTAQVRDELMRLNEGHTSLIALVFWLGFRRAEIPYGRRPRRFGKSAWTLRKKFDYLADSVFTFTNIPIRLITAIGVLGVCVAVVYGAVVAALRIFVGAAIPGYAATVITIAFFGGINALALGIIGSYTWRTYENTKQRPLSIIRRAQTFAGQQAREHDGGEPGLRAR